MDHQPQMTGSPRDTNDTTSSSARLPPPERANTVAPTFTAPAIMSPWSVPLLRVPASCATSDTVTCLPRYWRTQVSAVLPHSYPVRWPMIGTWRTCVARATHPVSHDGSESDHDLTPPASDPPRGEHNEHAQRCAERAKACPKPSRHLDVLDQSLRVSGLHRFAVSPRAGRGSDIALHDGCADFDVAARRVDSRVVCRDGEAVGRAALDGRRRRSGGTDVRRQKRAASTTVAAAVSDVRDRLPRWPSCLLPPHRDDGEGDVARQ